MRLPHKLEYEVSAADAYGGVYTVQVGVVFIDPYGSVARGVFCKQHGTVKLAGDGYYNIALNHLRLQHGKPYPVR